LAYQSHNCETTIVPLDLTDGEGIDRLGKAIFDRWGKLDGMIINAGMLGPISPLSHIAPKDFAKVMDINVTAPYRLVRSMDMLLKSADAGRVVFVSSSSAESARPYWGLYAASKAALNAMAKSYAGELIQTKLKANVFYPGAVRTAMRASAVPGEDPATLPSPAEIAPKLVNLLSPSLSENGQIFDMETGEFRGI
jgi:NAD(P)-dependent dehydrogenase (short-subunit alcohol dehydrogenase family)